MTDKPQPESGESTIAQSMEARAPEPGHFLKSIDEDTDVDASDVKDESDGMEKPDFLGKTNLENRGETADEAKQ
ncbi:hypothetical protein [Fibrella arboris]|uniref:hypothetical protein n=1 Tax=Fibrella arboris TaxID=3242486 RepID=UPI00352191B2